MRCYATPIIYKLRLSREQEVVITGFLGNCDVCRSAITPTKVHPLLQMNLKRSLISHVVHIYTPHGHFKLSHVQLCSA